MVPQWIEICRNCVHPFVPWSSRRKWEVFLPRRFVSILTVFLLAGVAAPQQPPPDTAVRTTLENGLRVRDCADHLARSSPWRRTTWRAATKTPAGYPGEWPTLRNTWRSGCAGLSGTRSPPSMRNWAGSNNADTQQGVTQYFATVPAQDLDIALRLDSA